MRRLSRLAPALRACAAHPQAPCLRCVSSSAESLAAAPAAAPAAASSKPPNVQEIKIYRWNPENASEKPVLQSYKA
jgi:hypothetical protein